MNYSRSVARALPKPCLPANEYGLSHVLRSIDEYLIPFLCHEVFTAAWHQYTPLTSYFEGPLRYGEKPVVLQCEVAIYINRCYARAIRYCQVALHKRNGLKSIEIREILRGEYDV
ncbi:hypothetical protein JG687_00016019 [Phytophthora cactorum]|uniref:Uncharacterized protein n=1 Tax=Phytophthora cactorum TaxID=29920 RepID=A0A8T1TUT1_9STRA|nr:hypothetical protein JG687_00016019 [Phytophthora cactorum]